MPQPTKALAVLLLALTPGILGAQSRAFELHLGRWYPDSRSSTYELRATRPWGASFAHGLTLTALVSDTLGRRRAFYGAGYQFQLLARRARLSPYFLGAANFGVSTDTTSHDVAILWSAGAGLEWRPLTWLGIGLEALYRLDDRGPRGFWRASPTAPQGMSVALGFSLGSAGRRETEGESSTPAPLSPPDVVTGNAAAVVETAIAVLGTPYQWGGTADNGFDCSGLIQYAYGQHGIRLPRRGQDQATAGAEVPPVVEALRPGDILLFSAKPNAGVTHVGMYVGDEKFIHSATAGVKLSRLNVKDPDGAYWLDRWVGARRIIP